MNNERGELIVVATPIGNLGDLSTRAVETLRSVDVICCEDTRHTGQLLHRIGVIPNKLIALHAHNEAARSQEVIGLIEQGKSVALVSDAGTPLMSDPGERLVAAAAAQGVTVSMVPGPFAGVAALVLSGFATERWTFEGFLPRRGRERKQRLSQIARADHPSVIYESPLRVRSTLEDLGSACGKERRVVIARELTKIHEEVIRARLADAIDHESVVNPRGEFVVVVDSAVPESSLDEADLRATLSSLLGAGLDRRSATKAVEVLLDVPHRRAFEAAHHLDD